MNPFLLFLSALRLREIVQTIPDARLNPVGGPWDARVPARDGVSGDIIGRDGAVPLAADLLARDARSRDVTEPSITLETLRAARINSSIRLTDSDVELLLRMGETNGISATDRASLLAMVAGKTTRRRESVAITRGLLLAGMALGEFSYARLGVRTNGVIDFGMPASLKIVPSAFWYGAAGAPNAAATPVTDMAAADLAASILGGAPYDALELSRVGATAIAATTEYQNAAKGRMAVYNSANLPVVGTVDFYALMGDVLRKRITVTESRYTYQDESGSNLTGRYVPANYAILFRQADEGSPAPWEWVNVPLGQSAIAAAGGDIAFGGGIVRGPAEYVTYDREEFLWARFHCVQEGAPNRRDRTCTARVKIANSESGA